MRYEHAVENPMVIDSLWNDRERKEVGTDALGNEIFEGDEVFEYNEELFVVEELSYDAREILELFGAVRKIAK